MRNSIFFIRLYEKRLRHVEIYFGLIQELSFTQGLSIVKGIADKAIESHTGEDLSVFIQALQKFAVKHQYSDMCELKDRLKKLHSLFNTYHTTLLLFTCCCQSGDYELSNEILSECEDETIRTQLKCVELIEKKEYEDASNTLKILCKISPHVGLLDNFFRKLPKDSKHLDLLLDVISLISTLEYQPYIPVINFIIGSSKRRFPTHTKALIDLFPEDDFVSPFNRLDLMMINKNYQKVYDILTNDMLGDDIINSKKTFHPYCNWLFICAKELGLTKELEVKISNLPHIDKSKKQLLYSLREYQNKLTTRTYRYSDNIICNNKLDILYCVNNSYYDGFVASISSLVINNKSTIHNLNFRICIDNSVSEEHLRLFLNKLKIRYSITNLDKKYKTDHLKIDYGINTSYQLDRSAYYRIFMIKDLVELEEIDKILYIDVDTLVLSDLSEIIDMEMSYPLHAAVEQQTERAVINSKNINGINNYFNSGILLIDPKHENIKVLIEEAIHNAEQSENLIMHDQCALNIAFNNNFAVLDPKYNFMVHSHRIDPYTSDICILHLSGREKPWQANYHQSEFLSKMWYSFFKAFSV